MINPSQTSLLFITGYFQHILQVIKTDLGHGNWEVINHNNSSFKALLCLSSLYLSSFSSAEVLKNPINCFNSSCGMYRQKSLHANKMQSQLCGLPCWLRRKKVCPRETRVWSLGRKDPLENEMATHSSILAWKIPWMEKPDGLLPTATGYCPQGRKEWDTTEQLHFHFSLSQLYPGFPMLMTRVKFCTVLQYSHHSS